MKLTGIIWLRDVVDKLSRKHDITIDEVEDVFNNVPRYRFIETGDVAGENLYAALGKPWQAATWLSTLFTRRRVRHW